METFAHTSALNADVREKNTKTNKITIVKNQNLQNKTSFLTCIYIFPLVTYKDFLLWKICLNLILWNIGIVYFIIELHQFTSGTPYIPQKRKENLQIWSLYHSRDRIVAASRPLQIYTGSANPIGAVLACFFFVFLFLF
jgi:hypothetical protein